MTTLNTIIEEENTPDTEGEKIKATHYCRLCTNIGRDDGSCIDRACRCECHAEWREVQVGDRVICDGLYTGKTGKVLGVGSSEHSIKLLVEGTERYEPDYALLEVTVENKRAVELLLSHYSLLTSRDTYWKERVREIIKCKRCNGQGGYLGASLGYSECEDCGGDGHCLYNREEEKLDDIIDNLK